MKGFEDNRTNTWASIPQGTAQGSRPQGVRRGQLRAADKSPGRWRGQRPDQPRVRVGGTCSLGAPFLLEGLETLQIHFQRAQLRCLRNGRSFWKSAKTFSTSLSHGAWHFMRNNCIWGGSIWITKVWSAGAQSGEGVIVWTETSSLIVKMSLWEHFEVQLCGFFPSNQAVIIVIYIHIASSSLRYCIKYCSDSALAPLILMWSRFAFGPGSIDTKVSIWLNQHEKFSFNYCATAPWVGQPAGLCLWLWILFLFCRTEQK